MSQDKNKSRGLAIAAIGVAFVATAVVNPSTAFSLSSQYNLIRKDVQKRAYARHSVTRPLSKLGFPASLELEDMSELYGLTSLASNDSLGLGDMSPMDLSCNEQREYEMKIGKAVDTLRKDYPDILISNPDFGIYHDEIEVVDPSGVTLHNLRNYKASFGFLHVVMNIFYCPEQSGLTFRLVYDCARKNIRVSWNAYLIPRAIYGGVHNTLHVDGISVYEIDRESGLINQHRVEHLLINDSPVKESQGIFQAIANRAMEGPEGIPALTADGGNMHFQFKHVSLGVKNLWDRSPKSMLFSIRASEGGDIQDPLFDQEAFDKKNASRRKFGLPPITPDEFIKIQTEVKAMDIAQRQKAAAASHLSNAADMAKTKRKENGLGKIFGNILEDSCESNYDCERPEVCCDFGFKKMCCRSGMGVFNGAPGQLQKIPVRVVADDGTMPRGGPGGMDDYY